MWRFLGWAAGLSLSLGIAVAFPTVGFVVMLFVTIGLSTFGSILGHIADGVWE